jgi:autoinducer 2-degrading protein
MYVVCVTIVVKEGHERDFVQATRRNHEGTRQEPGNRRFDVLRAVDEPRRFFLYEVYDSAEAFKAHQQTAHYLSWKEAVAEWMAEPRQGVKHESLFPAADGF